MTSRGWTVAGIALLGIVAVGGWAISARQGYLHRGRIGEAIQDGMRDEIRQALLAASGPSTFEPRSPYVQAIRLDRATHTIHITLDTAKIDHPTYARPGAMLAYTAIVEGGTIVGWQCARIALDPRILPAACR